MLKMLINRGWYPALITALAVAGYIYGWQIEIIAPSLIVILGIGLVVTIIRARDKRLELSAAKLRQLAGYFNLRFMGDSPLSIFTVIDGLFSLDNPKLWDWARACDMSRRIFNSWGDSFIKRVEGDFRARKFTVYLHHYLNELWSINNHYYEFVAQFYEVAEKMELSPEIIDQYQRFVLEYNAFVQNFRENITELRNMARTEIEPPSVRLARELTKVK